MKKIEIRTEYITLGQFLKYSGILTEGSQAKLVIQDGLVLVNGQVETRRGKKLYNGDKVIFDQMEYLISNENK